MRTVKKNVYYCDYCKKRSLSAAHMNKHETGCTANPDRYCKLCYGNEMGQHDIRQITEQLKTRFEIIETQGEYGTELTAKWNAEPITLTEIQKSVDDCPNCTLAILRQTGLNRYPFEISDKFDYKKERDEWFNGLIKESNREEYY